MTTAVTERPILFSAPMVQALLAGTKTQTRRIVKPQPISLGNGVWEFGDKILASDSEMQEHLFHEVYGTKGTPYGSLWGDDRGDRMWVRETLIARDCAYGRKVAYAADNLYLRNGRTEIDLPNGGRHVEAPEWKWQRKSLPSIHMPRWASRITLEITDVRVQRLAEISEEDAIAEGIHSNNFTGWGDEPGIPSMPEPTVYQDYSSTHRLGCNWLESPVDSYRTLWNSINGPGSWDANPFVWCVSFRRIELANR